MRGPLRSLVPIALAGLLVLGMFVALGSTSEAGTPFASGKVKLYSAGALVGEWESTGAVSVEGETLAFQVRRGTRDLDVRISGTWSFEASP